MPSRYLASLVWLAAMLPPGIHIPRQGVDRPPLQAPRGADARQRLLAAVAEGRADEIRALAASASLLTIDEQGRTTLMRAAAHGHRSVFAAIVAVAEEALSDAIFRVSASSGARTMTALLRASMSRRALYTRPDFAGATPLMLACKGGWEDMVDTLLAAGVDARSTDSEGRTAADYAEAAGFGELAARLRAAAR